MPTITNFEKWVHLNEWSRSPDCYIEFAFYSMISAALQRRVWVGPEHSKLFPNTNTILVGEPGLGKGLVIRPVNEILRYHKLEHPSQKSHTDKATPAAHKAVADALQEEDYKKAQKEEESKANNKESKQFTEKPLLIPIAADATTYEALVRALARSLRYKSVVEHSKELQKDISKPYIHSSLCFCLEEISSLFRLHTENLVHFLIQAYDCGDYTYDTKTQGRDKVRNCCLNILGGTTPGFMQKVFSDELLTEGFASRTWFIYATKNRKRPLKLPPLTDLQLKYKQELIEHTYKLIQLYGNATFTDEAWDYFEKWWDKEEENRPNTHVKLRPYYSRKNVHVQKLATAIHFGESTYMEIGIESVIKAFKAIDKEEKKMHYCLNFDRNNPLAITAEKVKKFIEVNHQTITFKKLLGEFWKALPGNDPKEEMGKILEYLENTDQIESKQEPNELTKQMQMTYRVKETEPLTL